MEAIIIKRYLRGEYVIDVEDLGQMWGFDRYEITIYLNKNSNLELITSNIAETTEYSVVTDFIENYFKLELK